MALHLLPASKFILLLQPIPFIMLTCSLEVVPPEVSFHPIVNYKGTSSQQHKQPYDNDSASNCVLMTYDTTQAHLNDLSISSSELASKAVLLSSRRMISTAPLMIMNTQLAWSPSLCARCNQRRVLRNKYTHDHGQAAGLVALPVCTVQPSKSAQKQIR